MKRYLKFNETTIEPICIVAEIVFGYDQQNDKNVAASHGVVPNYVPKTNLPHVIKDVPLGKQAQADYDSFIKSIEELIEDYYELHVYYRNASPDESHYYACLAKDSLGNLILDFKVKIRIANHDAHESKQADYNKKKEKQSEKRISNGKKLKPLYIQLVCNDENEEVSTYDEAYLWIDNQIDRKVDIMKRSLKYRKN